MAELNETKIYGDLYVNGVIYRGNNGVLNSSQFCIGGDGYIIPSVIWHGRLNTVSSPTIITYQSNNCSISASYISEGTVSITMSGSNIPSSSDNYYILANAVGRNGNYTSNPAYISSPSNYKSNNSFRLIVADDSTANDGDIELSIIKLIKFT